MIDKRYFARNADGSIKRKQPCQTEGCNWPNEHLCFVGKPDTMTAAIRRNHHLFVGTKAGGEMPEHQRAALSESQRQRHAEIRRRNLRRDLQIQADHQTGYTLKALAAKYNIGVYAVQSALRNSPMDHEI